VSVAAKLIPSPKVDVKPPETDSAAYGVILKFDRPVMVAPEAVGENVLISASYIPGGIIMGALARHGVPLDGVHIRSALACNSIKRPKRQALPLDEAGFTDGAGVTTIVNLNNKQVGFYVHASDLKDAARDRYLTPECGYAASPSLWTKTRTAIDAKTGTAEDGQLFSYAMLKPDISFSLELRARTAERATEVLNALPNALARIGKTQASVTHIKYKPIVPTAFPSKTNTYRIELVTEGCLLQPEAIIRGMSATEIYQTYFDTLGQSIKVEHALTAERWVAPPWLSKIKKLRFAETGYTPLAMLKPGSVFIVSGMSAEMAEDLADHGLPVTLKAWDEHDEITKPLTYKELPWVRENGWGEVNVTALNGDVK
jgi:hypothetical protein